jgi:hypothetical protein
VPKYHFNKQPNTVSKPLFFREWAWIGDDNFIWQMVYQDMIEQQEFTVNGFDSDDKGTDSEMKWYLTIGIYFGDSYWNDDAWFIGNFTRFCKSKITDYTAYFLPVIVNNSK